jgi:hypothetical protein
MPKDRRTTRYAKNYGHDEICSLRNLYTTVISDENGNRLPFDFTRNRYKVVNVKAYSTHRTLEFRQHSATTDETKVVNWILFTQRIMTTAQMFAEKKENLLNYSFGKIHNELGLGSELVEYFEKRKEILKANGNMETEYHGLVQIHHSSGSRWGFRRRRYR